MLRSSGPGRRLRAPASCAVPLLTLALLLVLFVRYEGPFLTLEHRIYRGPPNETLPETAVALLEAAGGGLALCGSQDRRARCGRAPAGRRRAYVLLMSDLGPAGRPMLSALRLCVASLLLTCPQHPVIVLTRPELVDHPHLAWFREQHNVEVRGQEPRELDARRYHYLKLDVWSMTEFDQVALFDADMVFLHNPDPIFDACQADLCAVPEANALPAVRTRKDLPLLLRHVVDEAWLRRRKIISFNAGMLVLRPNPDRGAYFFHSWKRHYQWHHAHDVISEQLMLNHFAPRVQYLAPTFNFQKASSRRYFEALQWRHAMRGRLPTALHWKYFQMFPDLADLLLAQLAHNQQNAAAHARARARAAPQCPL